MLTKAHFGHCSYACLDNSILYKNVADSNSNHSSLESQVELTGMLSSREQNPLPIPTLKIKTNLVKLKNFESLNDF